MRGIAYRVLCGGLGIGLLVFGLSLIGTWFGALRTDAAPAIPGVAMDPTALYFMAFTGCALVGWGGSLLGVLRHPASGRAVGTASAAALVLSAAFRLAAWAADRFPFPGNLPLAEAGLLFALAVALLWLRPQRPGRVAPRRPI